MKFREFEKFCQKNELRIFTISDVKVFFTRHSVGYLRLKISRWKEKGYLKSLKRGLYMLEDIKPDEFEIASKLLTPSYISLETALSHYSIIPDVSAEVASITTKNTRKFAVDENVFKFHHVKMELFFGFRHMSKEIFIATPEKAILDFLYLRKPGKEHLFFERINAQKLRTLDMKEMNKMAKKFHDRTRALYKYFKNVINR